MENIDKSWKGLYKFSSFALFMTMLLWLVAIVLEVKLALPMHGSALEQLRILEHEYPLSMASQTAMLVCCIIYVMAFPGIYISLRRVIVNKIPLIISGILALVAAAIESLVHIIDNLKAALAFHYFSETDAMVQAGYLSLIQFIMDADRVGMFFSIFFGGVAGIFFSRYMFAGVYSRKLAWLYLVTSVLGIISSFAYFPFPADLSSLLMFIFAIWHIIAFVAIAWIAVTLYSLGKSEPA